MNRFNAVFQSIKKECAKQKNVSEISNFEQVALSAGIPLAELDYYLNHLQDVGLIKYSRTDKFLYLTLFGKKQEKIGA